MRSANGLFSMFLFFLSSQRYSKFNGEKTKKEFMQKAGLTDRASRFHIYYSIIYRSVFLSGSSPLIAAFTTPIASSKPSTNLSKSSLYKNTLCFS